MKIREATPSDKDVIFEFCKNTFHWGDYIQDVWDYWIHEGNLFVVEKEAPLGICHAFFSNNQAWIEGIRIKNSVRRRGLASKLVTYVESLASKKGLKFSFMLIDTENFSSISMAENLNYTVKETWKFYSLIPQSIENYNINFGNVPKKSFLPYYVKSWRWLPLDDNSLKYLVNNNRIIYSDKEETPSFAILTDSEHFEKTLIVTFCAGSDKNNHELIFYLQTLWI